MDRAELPPSRERVFTESRDIIAKAARTGESVWAGHEAHRLYRENPDCGLSETDIRNYLVQLAVESKLPIDTSS